LPLATAEIVKKVRELEGLDGLKGLKRSEVLDW